MAFGPIMQLKVGDLRVELAPLSRDVMSEFVSPGMQQASIMKYLERSGARVLEDEYEWYDKVRQQKDALTWGIWVIENGERIIIGTTALHGVTHDPVGQATSGSMIFRQEYWGKGIASAIHKARTWYALQHLGLMRIKSEVIRDNTASRRALEKSGYRVISTERNTDFVDGQLRHRDYLECLNPDPAAWKHWWGNDRPTKSSREARQRTQEAMTWASKNVILL